MAALLNFLRPFGLSLLLFPVGLATHEIAHLAIYSALGVTAVLQVTQWHLGLPALSRVAIFGLHAAPLSTANVPLHTLVLNNGLGPLLAALPLLVLWLASSRRSRAVRAALLANVFVLLFFSGIEVSYPLLEEIGHVDADVLLAPELNYGVALGILLVGSGVIAWRAGPRLRVVSADAGSTAGRLPAP